MTMTADNPNRAAESAVGLEATVRELKDRVDILETMYAYCRHADNLDGDAMAALFEEDCVANFMPGGEETILRGRRRLNDFLSSALGVTVSGSHHISNAELIFETPDQVTLHCYMYSWQRFTGFPEQPDCHRWGRYENRFVRTPQGWRLTNLKLISAGEYGGDRIGEQLGRPFPPRIE